jgi:cyclase
VSTSVQAASLVEVADGVHAWLQPDGTWWLNNTGAVHRDGQLLLVDTCANRSRTTAMLAAVAAATAGAPVRWVVNTHQHGDHVYGNALLPGSTTVVGHRHMRAGLAEDVIFEGRPPFWTPRPDWDVPTRRLPDVTFETGLAVHVGDLEVTVHHPGFTAHTDGDVVVHVPEAGVLFAGDLLFHGLTPMLLMGSVDGARRSLEWIASFAPATVVPGHGPLIGAADLDRVLAEHDRYYRLVAATAAAGLAAGRTPLEAARTADLGEFAGWPDGERLVLNVHRAYADAAGVPVDLFAAMDDAMAWNGGPMHTHL